jgi:hypothetical protein
MFVPVVDSNQKPLMPTTSSRARRWVKSGKATPFWKKGVWCVRLNIEPSGRQTQDVVVGIDPGSKKEALTVASAAHCYLNIQADAVTWVGKAIKSRRQMRRARRSRQCPYRQPRRNRRRNERFLAPSTKARWQWKMRLVRWLTRLFPITCVAVEDVQATTKKGARRWNRLFSPLEVGKRWFYSELEKIAILFTFRGYETAAMRVMLGLHKASKKVAEVWEVHCVDGWVLTRLALGMETSPAPDNRSLLLLTPLRFHRRQLHRLQPAKGGIRHSYGGTRSLGLQRGSIVASVRYGLCYVGGHSGDRISLHSVTTGRRLTQTARVDQTVFRAYSSWRWRPPAGAGTRPAQPMFSASHSSHR